MTRTITALIVAVALFVAQTEALWAQRSRGSVSATSRRQRQQRDHASRQHLQHIGQRQRIVDGPERQRVGVAVARPRLTKATRSTRRSPRTAARRRPSARTSTSRTARSRRTRRRRTGGASRRRRERKVEGQGGYATVEGNIKTSTGREASTDLRRRPDRVRPAGRRGLGEHEVQRQLQRGRRAQPVRRLHEGGGRAVRRQGHDDAAVRLPHDRRTTAAPTTRYGGVLLPALHVSRRAPLLPGARARTTPTTAPRPSAPSSSWSPASPT